MKEQEKKKKPCTNDIQKNNLPDQEFKAIVTRMLIGLGKRIDEHSKNFNKVLENIKKN